MLDAKVVDVVEEVDDPKVNDGAEGFLISVVELAVVVVVFNPDPNEKFAVLADFVTSGALKLMVGVTDAVVSVGVGFLLASEPKLKLIAGFGVIVDETVADVIGVESSVFTVDVLKSTLKPVGLDVVKVLEIESDLVVGIADDDETTTGPFESCFSLSSLVDAESVEPNLKLLFFARSKVGSLGDTVDVPKENPEEAIVEDAGKPRELDKVLLSDDSVVVGVIALVSC